MVRARPDWVQTLDPESGHWCWYSALRQESRWEKPPIREGWMEWRDANGNAFYVDSEGGSTWDPPWADDAAEDADGAAAVPGMSPEAAARLAEAKLREELLGRVEGQYKLRGETCPLSVQKQTVAELEATLAELRGERAAGEE